MPDGNALGFLGVGADLDGVPDSSETPRIQASEIPESPRPAGGGTGDEPPNTTPTLGAAAPDEPGRQREPVEPAGREAWQASHMANNFPEGAGPFLPPAHIDDDTAWELFSSSTKRDFDRFVAERTDRVEALDRELRATVPQVHGLLLDGMRRAVEQGYVPDAALDRLGPAFTQTAIRAVDQPVLGDDLAVYEQRTDIMSVGTDAVDYDLEQTIAHELGGHKISGGTFIQRDDGTVVRVRRGFVNHDDIAVAASGRHYGLDEAIQHHLTLSYRHGEIDVMDPGIRQDGDMSYYEHRKLLAEFIRRSDGIVDLKAITRGSFEDTDESGSVTTDRRAMVIQATAAYGSGAYRKLNLLFEGIDFNNMSAAELVERIHSPVLDNDGTVIRPGFIDIEGLSFDDDVSDGELSGVTPPPGEVPDPASPPSAAGGDAGNKPPPTGTPPFPAEGIGGEDHTPEPTYRGRTAAEWEAHGREQAGWPDDSLGQSSDPEERAINKILSERIKAAAQNIVSADVTDRAQALRFFGDLRDDARRRHDEARGISRPPEPPIERFARQPISGDELKASLAQVAKVVGVTTSGRLSRGFALPPDSQEAPQEESVFSNVTEQRIAAVILNTTFKAAQMRIDKGGLAIPGDIWSREAQRSLRQYFDTRDDIEGTKGERRAALDRVLNKLPHLLMQGFEAQQATRDSLRRDLREL